MIRINLLPHREMRRERRKKGFMVHVGMVGALGLSVAMAVGYLINSQIEAQVARNQFIQARNADLDNQIKEIANLQAEIESLRARQTAVERLQSNRTIPVHMLDELVQTVPEGVFLKKLVQAGRTVTLTGNAQTTERIADLLRNLQSDRPGDAPSIQRPQLGEIKAITERSRDPKRQEERRLFEFSMNVLLKEPGSDAPAPTDGKRPAGSVASR